MKEEEKYEGEKGKKKRIGLLVLAKHITQLMAYFDARRSQGFTRECT